MALVFVGCVGMRVAEVPEESVPGKTALGTRTIEAAEHPSTLAPFSSTGVTVMT